MIDESDYVTDTEIEYSMEKALDREALEYVKAQRYAPRSRLEHRWRHTSDSATVDPGESEPTRLSWAIAGVPEHIR